eukprot:Em0597g3a
MDRSSQAIESTQADGGETEENASELLASALKKMDGLLGKYASNDEHAVCSDSRAELIRSHCEELKSLILEYESNAMADAAVLVDPRDSLPPSTSELLVAWFSKQRTAGYSQLQQDKEDLLKHVVQSQGEREAFAKENELLKKNVAMLQVKVTEQERKLQQRHQECTQLADELGACKAKLQAAAAPMDTTGVSPRQQHNVSTPGSKPLDHASSSTPPPLPARPAHHGSVTSSQSLNRGDPQRRSLKRLLSNAFKRRKDVLEEDDQQATSLEPSNPRAEAFFIMNTDDVARWLVAVGLEMLASIAANYEEMMSNGIVNTLHCKKLKLAVEHALSDQPCPLDSIGHAWVAEWIRDIGLECYQQTFYDARIDGNMLNSITFEDLELLDISTPFHITSIQRGIQAFRLCGYQKDYLKAPVGTLKGSQKLLYWNASHVMEWLKSVELDECTGALHNMGIHGAVMLLDDQFTAASVAQALGISQTQSLLWSHVYKKFMELVGPVAAQRKLDAMRSKSFVHLDPVQKAKKRRYSMLRNSKAKSVDEDLLCPLDKFPATECPPSLPQASPIGSRKSISTTSSNADISAT